MKTLKINRIMLFTVMWIIGSLAASAMMNGSAIPQVESQERTVGSFSYIKSTCSVDLYLYQGKTNKVVVETDSRYIDQVETYVEGKTLVIDVDGIIRNARTLKAYITFETLKGLEITGSGDVFFENTITTDEFEYEINGSGDLKLDIEAETVNSKINGSGDNSIKGNIMYLFISVNGSGDLAAELDEMKECNIRLTGSGDIRLSGSTEVLKIKQVSSGDISADKLKTDKCYIDKSGSGDTKVFVVQELTVSSSGSGDTYYKGSPELKSISVSGSGDVHSIN